MAVSFARNLAARFLDTGGAEFHLEVPYAGTAPVYDGNGVLLNAPEMMEQVRAECGDEGVIRIRPGLVMELEAGAQLVIDTHLMATGATVRYSGATPSVGGLRQGLIRLQPRDTVNNMLRDRVIFLPNVYQDGKPGSGEWREDDVGVELHNTNECEIHTGIIYGFTDNLLMSATGKGNAYNTIFPRHLYNGMRNFVAIANGEGGWVTENTIIGGRFSHLGGEGTNVSGVRHILLDYNAALASPASPNNMRFLGCSIEANVAEYHADIRGPYNYLEGLRWEASPPRVYVEGRDASAPAIDNIIIAGYNAQAIEITEGPNASGTQLWTGRGMTVVGNTAVGGPLRLRNRSGAAGPTKLTLSSTIPTYDADLTVDWVVRETELATEYKAVGDAFARIRITHTDGRIYLGNGTAEPDVFLRRLGTNQMSLGDGDSLRVQGTWDGGRLQLGTHNLWVDANGNLRIKNGAPTSDTDGTVVGAQT